MKIKYNVLSFLFILIAASCSKDDVSADKKPELPNENKAPSVPVLISPINFMECANSSLKFSWHTSRDPEGEPVFYEIELSNKDDFKDLTHSTQFTNTEIQLGLEPGKTYFWRIRAIDNNGIESEFSEVRSFFTEPYSTFNYVPYSPRVTFPEDYKQVDGDIILLEWQGEDPDGDEILYDLYFGTTNPPKLFESDLQTNKFKIELEEKSTYYWNIVVKDQNGAESVGEIWRFFKV